MSNIGTTIGLGKMGMKPTAGQVVKAQAAAKKKIGDLSYKPSDAQKKAILAAALKNVMKGEEKKEPAPKAKSNKNPPLKTILSEYTGEYQDYEDNDGNEVMYPTSDIKKLIKLAYKGKSVKEIAKEIGYSEEETGRMYYDNWSSKYE
jgi:DNA-binding NarL/FixJ family response regulator